METGNFGSLFRVDEPVPDDSDTKVTSDLKLRMQGRWKEAKIMLKSQKIQCHSKNNCYFCDIK